LKVIRQGIVLWAQFTQDALGVLIDVLEPDWVFEPDWGMPAAVETVERDPRPAPGTEMGRGGACADTAQRGTW
jgi:hypothetical protein